jgi:deoxyribodipyrimidine photo-lyase
MRKMDLFEDVFEFAATRQEALQQWRAFLPKAGRYAGMRNQVKARHENVSRLSPAVRLRLITEDEIVAETLERYAFSTVEKWLQEVCWRRYWKGWLEQRPGVWADYRSGVLAAKVSERAEAVMAGRSGVAVMDEFARELVETGYLHNHARMWWASFWIHVEGLPWELGADFFYRYLLDADAASNTLSWRWVAGLQTPGKTYLVRRSNVEKYLEVIADETGLEQLEDGRVKARFISETADLTVREWRACASSVKELRARVGVWIHGDDLSVECSAELKGCKPVAATAFLAATRVLSEKREAHLERALQDACARATMQWGVPVGLERGEVLVRHLVDWVQRERVDVMVAMRPFVGPLGDEIETIEAELGKVGVRCVWLRRASDEKVLPLARRGFFPFWEKLSRELRSKSDLMRKEEHE